MSLLCRHRNQTTPRRDEAGQYRRCLECGKRIPWSWNENLHVAAAARKLIVFPNINKAAPAKAIYDTSKSA